MKKKRNFQAIAEKILKDSGIFRDVYESAPQPMCLLLPDKTARGGARFLAMNAAAQKAHGVPAEKVAGLDAAAVFPQTQPDGQDSPPLVCALIEGTKTAPEIFHPRIRLRRQDGHEWDAECSAHSVTVAGQRIVVATPKDITDRLGAENALRESETRFHRLFLQAPVCIALADLEGRYTQANPAFCRLLGYRENEIVGKTFGEISHPDDIPGHILNKAAMLKGELDVYITEKRYIRKNGEYVWVHLSVSVLRDKDGEPHAFLAVSKDISQRHKAEAALRESEEKFRRLFSEGPVGIALTGLDGRFIQNNPAFCRLLGYSEKEFKGKHFAEFTHPDDAKNNIAAGKQLAQGKIRLYETDKRYIRKDGDTVWVHMRVTTLRDDKGTPQCFLASFEDITWRRRMEDNLRESEEKFRSLFSQSPIPTVLADIDGRFLEPNAAYCDLLQRKRADLVGRRFTDFIHADHHAQDLVAMKAMLSGKLKFYQKEERHVRKDGGLVWTLSNVMLIKDADGKAKYFLAQVRDISRRREAESALRKSERKFRSFFEQSPIGIASLNKNLGIQEVNPAFAKMLGYTVPELLKKSMLEITHPENISENKQQIGRVLKGIIPFFLTEKSYYRKDGGTLRARVTSSSIRDENGKPLNSMAMIEDITWSRQAEKVLRERERLALAGGIATGIAHEINNPLNIILGLAEVAGSEHKLPAKARKDLASIAAHAKRAGAVTRGLLQFGRRTKPHKERTSIRNILDTAVTLVGPDLKKSKIKLTIKKPASKLSVCVDPDQIQQALINLILNAKQAVTGRPRREITLDAKKRGEFVLFRVKDTGPGIPKKIAHRIFEPFFT
ncbi:MAG: PAS domain S-box protein, partial [Elusimicrobiota bacterium]